MNLVWTDLEQRDCYGKRPMTELRTFIIFSKRLLQSALHSSTMYVWQRFYSGHAGPPSCVSPDDQSQTPNFAAAILCHPVKTKSLLAHLESHLVWVSNAGPPP